nr:hypothetical protein [Tanacetum cinerariifolium]
ILKHRGEGTCFQLSQRFIAACSYPTNNYKDIMKAQSYQLKLEQQKEKVEAEVAFLKAQPLHLDVNQLTKLLCGKCIKSYKQECSFNISPAEGEKNTKDTYNANPKQQPTTTTLLTNLSFHSPISSKRKGKEVMSFKDIEEEETESDSEDDHANVESSKQKKLKKFSFVTEGDEQIYLTVEKIKSLKVEFDKQEVEKEYNCNLAGKSGYAFD